MSPPRPDAEQVLEDATVELFRSLGWEAANAYHEAFPGSVLGRENSSEIILKRRLRAALDRLNPDLPLQAIQLALEDLSRDRSALSLPQANRETYRLLRDGVKVQYLDDDHSRVTETVRVIDWDDPEQNDFLVVQQLWVTGELHKRRPDLVGFVNGLPLVFVELKAPTRQLESAYHDNLRDYKDTIPQVFWFNGLVVLSNGRETRVGSLTSAWEHFAEWKKIGGEEEAGVVSLETLIRGTCHKPRLLDLLENFTLFWDATGALTKILAKNHQFLGVNNAIDAVHDIRENQGRLGVFWHTQGSGKSFSMIFFAQKVLRKLPGNWTFVVVTDRLELDKQIYKNFASVGAVTEPEEAVRARSGKHLRELLGENHRYVFTLVHKFNTDEFVSDRDDIIVMTDEAHRSQYDILAANMRSALPNAAFIGFTGTPLLAGEEKTREVFGDYVSIYDFKQSVEDNATVPLYYENRIPELQLLNDAEFNEEIERILEAAELDEDQEKRLEREFSREYHLITREERLDTIAADLVDHFLGRGYLGKAMVVCIDKATAVRMYDKVKEEWEVQLRTLKAEIQTATRDRQDELLDQIPFMEETDLAVVVSQAQNEIDDFRKKGLDIRPHRERMVKEDLETRFKDPEDPFRIVFVCAMWMTGFDAPAVSTIYLDKPMKNHTLMQTIARANRVFGEKQSGLIVDYVGVFRDLQKALAIYGTGRGGGGQKPIREKGELVGELEAQLKATQAFCSDRGADLRSIPQEGGFERVAALEEAMEALLVPEEAKKQFLVMVTQLKKLYKAVLPSPAASVFTPAVSTLSTLAKMIQGLSSPASVDEVMREVEDLLDRSVGAQPFVIRPETPDYGGDGRIDLSQIDFELLREKFDGGNRKRAAAARLQAVVGKKVEEMVRQNRTRVDFLQKFQELIDEYNAGSRNVESFFEELMAFTKRLSEEEARAVSENLTEEELAIFDLLMRPGPDLSSADEQKVKEVARELLETLKEQRLVLDWRKRQQNRAAVRVSVEEILDELPRAYTKALYNTKCDLVYQHVFESYPGAGTSVYEAYQV